MEVNWAGLFLVAMLSAASAVAGRLLFRRWFNPLSIYALVWFLCLGFYELRLIEQYSVSTLAWTYILLVWFSLFGGAAFACFLAKRPSSPVVHLPVDLHSLRRSIIVLTALGGLAVAAQVRMVVTNFGGFFTAILTNAGDLYRGRLSGELSGIPYIGALLYAACTLAGVYTARKGKLTLVAVCPLTLLALNNVISMARAGVVMTAFLFLPAFLHTPKQIRLSVPRWQQVVALVAGIAILVGGFVLVSSVRGLGVQFPGITPAMDEITEYIPVFPSIYSNFAAPPVALSLYLSSPAENHDAMIGQFTFAPVLRALSRLGFHVPDVRLEEDYYTPISTNTCTWVKNIHSDFGLVGLFIFPFLMGSIITVLALRIERQPRLVDIVLLAHAYPIIVFSFVVNLMAQGDWYVSIVGVAIAAAFVRDDRLSQTALSAHATNPPL